MSDAPSAGKGKARFRCPRCLGRVSAAHELIGLFVSCAHCQARVRVPIPVDLSAIGLSPAEVMARQADQVERALQHARASLPGQRGSAQTGVASKPVAQREPGADPFPLAPTPAKSRKTSGSVTSAPAPTKEAPAPPTPATADHPAPASAPAPAPQTQPNPSPAPVRAAPVKPELEPDPLAALAAESQAEFGTDGAPGQADHGWPVPAEAFVPDPSAWVPADPAFVPEHSAELEESDEALRALAQAAEHGPGSSSGKPNGRC
ncbi:MAG: hypothetical protein AAF288_07225 [Planctomycetota bacterium]